MTDPNTATPTPNPVDPIAHEDSPAAEPTSAPKIVDLEAIAARVRQWRENVRLGDNRDSLSALEEIEALLGIKPTAPANDTAKV